MVRVEQVVRSHRRRVRDAERHAELLGAERENLPFVPNEAGVGIRVEDVAAARAELEAKGVEFIAETWDSAVCHFAAFRDPDGNTVILHRRYAPRTPRELR